MILCGPFPSADANLGFYVTFFLCVLTFTNHWDLDFF